MLLQICVDAALLSLFLLLSYFNYKICLYQDEKLHGSYDVCYRTSV